MMVMVVSLKDDFRQVRSLKSFYRWPAVVSGSFLYIHYLNTTMRYCTITLCFLLTSLSGFSQEKSTTVELVQQAIHTAFEAFSESSLEKMEEVVTPDVKILEHGEVWTLDSIRYYFGKKRPADFKRVNTLSFFQTEIEGKMAFVSYHNQADFHANNRDRTVRWLESAVLVNDKGKWKIKMLHSTRKE
jgi:hypothetical protein